MRYQPFGALRNVEQESDELAQVSGTYFAARFQPPATEAGASMTLDP